MCLKAFFKKKAGSGKFRLTLLAVILLLLIIGISFCKGTERVDYLTETVRLGNIEQKVTATGQVSAVQLVDVGAQVSGQIETLYVHLGQEVKKGDMVADIDSTTQENDLAINKAKLETYQAQLNSRKIALKIAQTQYNRERKLKLRDATSAEQLENFRNELAAAEAAVIEMESLLKQTQIAVNTSEVNLGYTKISSPLDGVVVSVAVEAGQTVNANQTTPTIVQIADLSEMEIKIEISEGDITKVKPGMPVSFTILSEPDQIYETTLKSIDPGLATLTDGTYTGTTDASTAIYYYGKLIVPNNEGKLRIGMTTQNTITISSAQDVLVVSTMAIYYVEGHAWVDVLQKDGKIVSKQVTTGLSDNMNTEIISGLSEGEEVVLASMTQSEIDSSASGGRRPRMRL